MHKTKQIWYLSSIVLLLCGMYTPLFAQDTTPTPALDNIPKDVKVGLILSGGGAKGLAHIGALKIIEKAGVRIDYIGGTSMGAIVGALYASGYKAHQLDSLFKAVDFNKLIQDNIPRHAKTFYEREDSEKYAVTLPFDHFKIGLPIGLSKGQNFYNRFTRLTSHVSMIKDFSKLPIPFFCMATNIETGKQVLLDHGYLPEAVSASSALPSIFSPVEIDGILLTDGGVANNYPVEEIRNKGVEIVIGVDVQDSLLPRKRINSVTNIMLQISNFKTIKAMKTKRPKTDVYIKPEIGDYSLISFDDTEKIIYKGEKAAFQNISKLTAIAKQQSKSSAPKRVPTISDTLHINSLSISGNSRYTRSYIKGKLKLKTPKTTTYNKLYEGINNLAATGNFDRISHRLLNNDQKLTVHVKEGKNKMLLRFAMHYDDLYKTAALLNVTKKNLFLNNDVLSFDAILGDNIRYNLEYYIDKGFYWSIGIKNQLTRFTKGIDYAFFRETNNLPNIAINTIDIDYMDINLDVYGETLLKQTLSFGLGASYKRLRIISETIGMDRNLLPRTVFDNSDYWGTLAYLKLDSYDNKYFPTEGFLLNSEFRSYLFSSDFTDTFDEFSILKAQFGYATKITKNIAMNIELDAGTKIGNTTLPSLDFFLGGFGAQMVNNFTPFYGYDFWSITGDSFAKAALTFDYEIFKNNHINATANIANVGSKLYSTGRWFESPEYSGYALGYGLDTFAGPLQIKYSYTPDLGESNWYFSIGFWF